MGNQCGNLMGCNDTELQLDLQIRAAPIDSVRGSKIIIKSDVEFLICKKDSLREQKGKLDWASEDSDELNQNPQDAEPHPSLQVTPTDEEVQTRHSGDV